MSESFFFINTCTSFRVSSFAQAALLAMFLVGVRNEPQGPAYLPPGPRTGGGGTGHPDDWAGVSMYLLYIINNFEKKKEI